MVRISRKPITATKDGLNSVESGGLFLVNMIGLWFFFTAASASAPFFFLYLAYVLNTWAQVYDRGLGGTMRDVKAFFRKVLPI
jgi:hypothetical protein